MAKSLQSCPTLCDPMDCSLPGSSVHGIIQAKILEWVAMPFSGESSLSSGWTHVSLSLLHWQVFLLPLPPPGKPHEGSLAIWQYWTQIPQRQLLAKPARPLLSLGGRAPLAPQCACHFYHLAGFSHWCLMFGSIRLSIKHLIDSQSKKEMENLLVPTWGS